MEVKLPDQAERGYAWVVGLRNSHDKTFPAGLVAGTSVFTCYKLAFSGEVKIRRTRFAYRDLLNLNTRAVDRLGDKFHSFNRRIEAYRDEPVQDWCAHDLIIRAVDCRAITNSQVPETGSALRSQL